MGLNCWPERWATSCAEAALGLQVAVGDLGRGDAVDRAEVLVVVRHSGISASKSACMERGEPGSGVDAVGDGVDVVVREHLLRDLAVLHGDAVDVARERRAR